MSSIFGTAPPGTVVRLAWFGSGTAKADPSGAFTFSDLAVGWYILAATAPGFRETALAVRVQGDRSVKFELPALPARRTGRPPVLTVCEALDSRDSLSYQPAVIVGIFKSGMDETLRLDCPTQLQTGDLGWPASIGLTRPTNPPDELRDEVEKKRQTLLQSAPSEAPLRPERVVGLYGIFVSPAGLTAAPCCTARTETTLPPARLFGIGETDLRVIR